MRKGALVAILAIGLGVTLAPAAFRMFSRAPLGGQMIEEFRPFMRAERLDAFEGHLTHIGSAVEALRRQGAGLDHPLVAGLDRQWQDIDADMTGMLDTIRDNLDNFAAIDALPDFPLFPWFFVIPGLLIAGLAWTALRKQTPDGELPSWARWSLVGMGVGLVAAPAVFMMFTRAPLGAAMIDEFRPLMRPERITAVQGYFLTIGGAEGALRTGVLAEVENPDAPLPEVHALIEAWPAMAGDMAPMIGAMSDNLDNFAAVAALPPFGLFPWFFVIPGLLVAGLALLPPGPGESEPEQSGDEPTNSRSLTA